MSLKSTLSEDMKGALRAKDAARLSAIRLLMAAIKQREVDERIELGDGDVISIIEKMVKQRRESISHYEKGGRSDLVEAERFEISVLSAYLPQPLSAHEIDEAIAAVLSELGATAVSDMGRVMASLRTRLAGRADMAQVSSLVKARLVR